MAPTDQKMKNNKFTAKGGNWKKSKSNAQGVKMKRKWVPEQKIFKGNIKEGTFWPNTTTSKSSNRTVVIILVFNI